MAGRIITNMKNNELLSGEITPEDKLDIVNVGQYFIELGRKLQEVKTYEEHADLIDAYESKTEDFDKMDSPIMNSVWD